MYILYHFPYSQHARRVVSLLAEANLECELRHVDMAKGAHRSAAIIVNPYDARAVGHAIQTALTMSLAERRERYDALMIGLRQNDVTAWTDRFVSTLAAVSPLVAGQVDAGSESGGSEMLARAQRA